MKLRVLLQDLFCFLVLLCIPGYFSSQTKDLLPNLEASHIVSIRSESGDEEIISLIPIPSPGEGAPCLRAQGKNELSVVSPPHTSQPIRRFRSVGLQSGWTACADYWCKLWRIIASVSFTILLGSSALLQMPGAGGDPLMRCFMFLFIFRLLPSSLSAMVLLYFFSKKHFRSGKFAMIWYYDVKCHQSCFFMPWTILAFPAIAIAWGAIFMVMAAFLSVWGDGLYPNLSTVEKVSPLTIMSLRAVITAMSVVDIGWFLWFIVRLSAFEKAAKIAHDSAV